MNSLALSTNEDTLRFLKLYEQESTIWNPKHIHHKDKKMVNMAWVRISNKMEMPVVDLKKKKESLMATFRQHLRKKKASLSSGCPMEDVYHPIWVFYDPMESFLRDVYEYKTSTQTHDTKPKQDSAMLHEEVSIKEESEPRHDADEEELDRTSTVTCTPDRAPSPRTRNALKRRLSHTPEPRKAGRPAGCKAHEVGDICDQYGKLLAAKLRKYFADVEQHEVMLELDELMAKRIRNRLYEQRFTPSPSGSLASTSTAGLHRP